LEDDDDFDDGGSNIMTLTKASARTALSILVLCADAFNTELMVTTLQGTSHLIMSLIMASALIAAS